MTNEDLYEDYLLICKMKSPEKIKIGMLTFLFVSDPYRWRVVGITQNALLKFAEIDFEYKTGMKIQRAHLNNRSDVYKQMMNTKFKYHHDWWDFYHKYDETVLALASENRKIKTLSKYEIDHSEGLFRSHSYIWLHDDKAKAKLRVIYETQYLPTLEI